MSRPMKVIVPASGGDAAAEQADEGGLARAVGADQGVDLVGLEVEIDLVHGLEPAEMAGEAARLEDHGSHGRNRARSAPSRPRGAKRTRASSATPTTIRCASVTALERSIR